MALNAPVPATPTAATASAAAQIDYHHKVETAFRLIAIEEPERVVLVDASGPQDEVTERLLDAIADLLP